MPISQIDFNQVPAPGPVNYDQLLQSNFRLLLPKLPKVQLFLQGFTLPNLAVGKVDVFTTILDYNEIGEKLKYEPFECTFMVDTGLTNYREIYDWMNRMIVRGSTIGETDNMVLMINEIEVVRFYDCWPTSLSGIEFMSNPETATYIQCKATFEYDYFEFLNR